MARPAALTESGGSKVIVLGDSTATTPLATTACAVTKASAGGDTTLFTAGWLGVASHVEGNAVGSPGGFTASTPCVLIAGKTAAAGNAAVPFVITGTTPATSDPALVVKLAGIAAGTSVPVTFPSAQAVTISSGTVTTVSTVTAVTTLATISNALPTGTNTLGGTSETGWNFAALAQQRGRITLNSVSETTLLSADASNLYNVTDVIVSTNGGAEATLTFRHGTAGTTFLVLRLPASVSTQSIGFKMPDRGAVNQTVTAQSSSATPNIEILVHAYKSAS